MARPALAAAAVAALLSAGVLGCGDVLVLPVAESDGAACVEGSACTPVDPCHRGMTSCADGAAVCVDAWVALSDGAACGPGLACSAGACVTACVPDQPCEAENPCSQGVTSCPTTASAAVCVAAQARPDASSCGEGRVCRSGACVDQGGCRSGEACEPADPCREGRVSCTTSSRTGTCAATGTRPDGTACGARQACRQGSCVGPPAVRSFVASPANVAPGSPATLSWEVTGADAVAVEPAVGGVTGTSATVHPPATTVYTLTASNVAGSTQLRTTVTVSAIARMTICGAGDATVRTGRTLRITPSFQVATGTPPREVEWWLDPGALGSVSPSRGESTTYTAPDAEGRYRIWARSTWDPTKQDDCWITVTRAPGHGK